MTSKHAKKRPISADEVFDSIEAALEAAWEADDNNSLPEELRDPIRVRERGQHLLATGLVVASSKPQNESCEEEFRMAARNGKSISEEMLATMHADRERVEAQQVLTFDEP